MFAQFGFKQLEGVFSRTMSGDEKCIGVNLFKFTANVFNFGLSFKSLSRITVR